MMARARTSLITRSSPQRVVSAWPPLWYLHSRHLLLRRAGKLADTLSRQSGGTL